MEIVYKKVSDLIPYENNPRINDEAVEYVANSIKEFGFKVPIVIDKNNVIIAGHTRLRASEQLGINEVPCIIADDLSQEQVKAFRLADNKVGEVATWDFELLDKELEDIIDIDMSMFDFNTEELDSYIDDLLENDFAGQKQEITQFTVSFHFDKKYEDILNNYIKETGKDKISQYIIDLAKGENENA